MPLDLLRKHGLTRDDAVSGKASPALRAALADLRALARRHYEAALAALAGVDPAELPAFLPLMLVPGDLARMERPHDPFKAVPAASPLSRTWRLWRGRLGAAEGRRGRDLVQFDPPLATRSKAWSLATRSSN